MRILTTQHLRGFDDHLRREEKSSATRAKYRRDAARFFRFAHGRPITKDLTVAYKQHLLEQGYALRSVNSMLAALNGLLTFLGWTDCRVKTLKCQRRIYCPPEQELTKTEYQRLVTAARQPRLKLVLQTLCSTGIRVSELKYFTREAVQQGEVTVRCKNKTRTILVPGKLRQRLLTYARQNGITGGPIFLTRHGNPLDRSNLWAQMKGLCRTAGVPAQKVFPHNLRKLFARTFYALEKDIAKLADILGHSSIETTRIYIMTTGAEHRRKLERLGLVV